jgi:hypothetical protein
MSPLILSPAIDNSKLITPGMLLYRGMPVKLESMTPIGPRNPLQINLDSPSEIVNLIFDSYKPQMHILQMEEHGHFVSFSLLNLKRHFIVRPSGLRRHILSTRISF